jgi:hypothetical protein
LDITPLENIYGYQTAKNELLDEKYMVQRPDCEAKYDI